MWLRLIIVDLISPMNSFAACFSMPVAGNSCSLPLSTNLTRNFPRQWTRSRRIFTCTHRRSAWPDSSSQPWNVPVLSSSEVFERLKLGREGQQFLAMYSSVVGGITTDPAAMVLPLDDHMVHRGHGVFDTAMIVRGYLYELDQHLDRILRSASMARIPLPFDRETIRRILIQTTSVSGCRNGSLRYWLSAGPGDFLLSPSGCLGSAFYAIVLHKDFIVNRTGLKVVTSSIPIKPPEFAIMKSVNYLPNALSQMEAEDKNAYASIWVDKNGIVAEGPNMNVAYVFNGGKDLVIPRFDNVLSGCTAKRTLTLAEQLVTKGMLRSVRVMDVTIEDGKKADEMMLLGSGVLIRPVIQWDEELIGDGKEGPVSMALLDLLLEDMSSGPPTVRFPVPY